MAARALGDAGNSPLISRSGLGWRTALHTGGPNMAMIAASMLRASDLADAYSSASTPKVPAVPDSWPAADSLISALQLIVGLSDEQIKQALAADQQVTAAVAAIEAAAATAGRAAAPAAALAASPGGGGSSDNQSPGSSDAAAAALETPTAAEAASAAGEGGSAVEPLPPMTAALKTLRQRAKAAAAASAGMVSAAGTPSLLPSVDTSLVDLAAMLEESALRITAARLAYEHVRVCVCVTGANSALWCAHMYVSAHMHQ
jgi:hypothetical protein